MHERNHCAKCGRGAGTCGSATEGRRTVIPEVGLDLPTKPRAMSRKILTELGCIPKIILEPAAKLVTLGQGERTLLLPGRYGRTSGRGEHNDLAVLRLQTGAYACGHDMHAAILLEPPRC